jgi:hypothetical protein
MNKNIILTIKNHCIYIIIASLILIYIHHSIKNSCKLIKKKYRYFSYENVFEYINTFLIVQ